MTYHANLVVWHVRLCIRLAPDRCWVKLRDEVGGLLRRLSHSLASESGPSARTANQLASSAHKFELFLLEAPHISGSLERNSTRPVPLHACLHDFVQRTLTNRFTAIIARHQTQSRSAHEVIGLTEAVHKALTRRLTEPELDQPSHIHRPLCAY